jgi:SNF2 family DNA or RNA helicase
MQLLKETDLKSHQLEAIEAIITKLNFALFFKMGAGKTVSVLTAINILIYKELAINKVLVIGPKRVASTVWAKEHRHWEHLRHLKIGLVAGNELNRIEALNIKSDIYAISRDNVQWLIKNGNFRAHNFDMLVIDELTSFKNHASKRFKALRSVRGSFKRIVGMTGTPTPEGLMDLWAQMQLIDGGERLERTITAYRRKYFIPDKRNGNIIYSYKALSWANNVINEKIKDICLVHENDYSLEVPECNIEVIDVILPQIIMSKYKKFERDKVLELIDQPITAVNAASLTGKLSQFANGAVYYDDTKDYKIYHNYKLKALKEIIDKCTSPIVVAYWFNHDKELILNYLKDYNPVVMEGENTVSLWNSGAVKVLLVHPMSAGHGLNLQFGGHRLVWFGLTASQELNAQLNKRLHRPGQKNNVIVQYLCAKGTQDERTIASIMRKNQQQDNFIEEVRLLLEKYRNGICI